MLPVLRRLDDVTHQLGLITGLGVVKSGDLEIAGGFVSNLNLCRPFGLLNKQLHVYPKQVSYEAYSKRCN